MYLYSLWKKISSKVTLKLINKTTKDHIEIKKNVIDDSCPQRKYISRGHKQVLCNYNSSNVKTKAKLTLENRT